MTADKIMGVMTGLLLVSFGVTIVLSMLAAAGLVPLGVALTPVFAGLAAFAITGGAVVIWDLVAG